MGCCRDALYRKVCSCYLLALALYSLPTKKKPSRQRNVFAEMFRSSFLYNFCSYLMSYISVSQLVGHKCALVGLLIYQLLKPSKSCSVCRAQLSLCTANSDSIGHCFSGVPRWPLSVTCFDLWRAEYSAVIQVTWPCSPPTHSLLYIKRESPHTPQPIS